MPIPGRLHAGEFGCCLHFAVVFRHLGTRSEPYLLPFIEVDVAVKLYVPGLAPNVSFVEAWPFTPVTTDVAVSC